MSIRLPRATAAVLVWLLAGCWGGGGGTSDPQTFCNEVETLARLVQGALVVPETADDLTDARATADAIAASARRLQASAPEEIRDDGQALAGATAELATEVRDFYQALLDEPGLATDPQFLAEFQPVTEERRERLDDAGQRIRPWLAEHCPGVTVETPAEGG